MRTRTPITVEFESRPGGKYTAEVHHAGYDWMITIEPPSPCYDPGGPDMYPHYMDVECTSEDKPPRSVIYDTMSTVQYSTGFRTYGAVIYSPKGIAAFVAPYFPLDSWDRVGISKFRV